MLNQIADIAIPDAPAPRVGDSEASVVILIIVIIAAVIVTAALVTIAVMQNKKATPKKPAEKISKANS